VPSFGKSSACSRWVLGLLAGEDGASAASSSYPQVSPGSPMTPSTMSPQSPSSAVPMPVPLHSLSSSPPDDGAALNAYLQNGRRDIEELHSSSITSVPEDSAWSDTKSDAFQMSYTGSDKSDGDVFRLSFNPERYSPPPNPSHSQNAPSHSQAGQIEPAPSTNKARPPRPPNSLARPTMMAESPRSRSFMGGLLGSSRW